MKGVYRHCAKKHLHRYAAEFEFRYINRSWLMDSMIYEMRAAIALRGIIGKRLAVPGLVCEV